MNDEFFSEQSQLVPPQTLDSTESKFNIFVKKTTKRLHHAILITKKLQTVEIVEENKSVIQTQIQSLCSALNSIIDLLPSGDGYKLMDLRRKISDSSNKQKIPLQVPEIVPSPKGNRKAKRNSPKLASPSPRRKLGNKFALSPLKGRTKNEIPEPTPIPILINTSESKPAPPSRENRPALKDVSVFTSVPASVDVSINHFRNTKKNLRPFEVETVRRYTAFPKQTESIILTVQKLRRWNSGPNLNSWEMPKDTRTTYYPPVFKPENSIERLDAQKLINRQPKIRESLRITKTPLQQSQLTFALTEDNYSLIVGGELSALFEWLLERSKDWIEIESMLIFHREFCSTEDIVTMINY